MRTFGGMQRVRDAMVAAVQQSDSASRVAAHGRDVAAAAIREAKLTNKNGDVTKRRLVGAAVRPTTTASRLLRGAAVEAIRQGRKPGTSPSKTDETRE